MKLKKRKKERKKEKVHTRFDDEKYSSPSLSAAIISRIVGGSAKLSLFANPCIMVSRNGEKKRKKKEKKKRREIAQFQI